MYVKMIIDASYCGIEKGVDVIGAVSISSNIGKDFGEICGIEHPLGVKITNDPEEVISNHDMASVSERAIAQLQRNFIYI